MFSYLVIVAIACFHASAVAGEAAEANLYIRSLSVAEAIG
jgi:hypothetical protein